MDVIQEKSDQRFLREYNIKKILNLLRKHGNLSRVELAAMSNLDKKTVTNIVKELLEQRQVKIISKSSEGIGRPKEMLAINGGYCHCIGIDLGGTHISGVLLDFTGKMLFSHNVELNNDMEPDTLIKLCFHVVDMLLKEASGKKMNIEGMGISIPGIIDKEAGLLVLAENMPKWHNIPLKKLFADKYGMPIYVEDCSRAMALAELRYGDGVGCDNFLVIDLGLGIGCGIVLNGSIFAGATGKSGEIGHTVLEVDGPLCTCGRRGCIEAMASGWALSKCAKKALENDESITILREIVSSEKGQPTIKDIVLAADLGDKFCIRLLKDAGRYIGVAIANAMSFYNPLRVLIGGRMVEDNHILLKQIEETIMSQAFPPTYQDASIGKSKIGFFASAIGAATLCIEEYY